MSDLLLVVLTSPDDLHRFLGLELDDADVELLVEKDDVIGVSAVVSDLGDVGYALVEGTLDDV